MRYCELTAFGGKSPIWVNPANVGYFQPNNSGTFIVMNAARADGPLAFTVLEEATVVAERLEAALRS